MMNRDEKARKKMKIKKGKKILIIGASIQYSTGNSKLIMHMSKELQKRGHTLYTIGLLDNRPQKMIDNIPTMPGLHCEKCGNATAGDENRIKKYAEMINLIQPNIIICVGDPYQYQQFGLGNLNLESMKNTVTIMYATIDSDGRFCNEELIRKGLRPYIEVCDKVIGTAEFSKKMLKKHFNIDTDYIHEAIDTKKYYPLNDESKELIRKKKYRFKKDDFIIYAGGRNIQRKRPLTLLDACAKFLTETKNTYLLLNTPPNGVDSQNRAVFPDALNPVDFIKRVLKNKYGRDLLEEGRIIFVEREGLGSYSISEDKNVELYRISDVFLSTTGGEGFGLMPVESMCCGVPVIIPNNSTGRELVGEMIEPAEECSPYTIHEGGLLTATPFGLWVDWGLRQRLATEETTYEALKKYYEDKKLREELKKNCRKQAVKKFNLESFGKAWNEVVKNVKKKDHGAEAKKEFKKLELGDEE